MTIPCVSGVWALSVGRVTEARVNSTPDQDLAGDSPNEEGTP